MTEDDLAGMMGSMRASGGPMARPAPRLLYNSHADLSPRRTAWFAVVLRLARRWQDAVAEAPEEELEPLEDGWERVPTKKGRSRGARAGGRSGGAGEHGGQQQHEQPME